MDDNEKPRRSLSIEVEAEGLEEISDKLREINDMVSELNTTLDNVTLKLNRIARAFADDSSDIHQMSEELYDLCTRSPECD